MDEKAIMLEELKILEDKINRHANLAFQNRGWLFAILVALVIGLYEKKLHLGTCTFLLFAYLIILAFFIMELIQRLPQKQALSRASTVEKMIRGELPYNGPKISDSLSMGGKFKQYYQSITGVVAIPYICILLIITLFAFVLN